MERRAKRPTVATGGAKGTVSASHWGQAGGKVSLHVKDVISITFDVGIAGEFEGILRILPRWPKVLEAGAASVAVISALMRAKNLAPDGGVSEDRQGETIDLDQKAAAPGANAITQVRRAMNLAALA